MKKINRAILSVYDKAGIVDFAKILVNEFNIEILSTGGTGRLLEENGIKILKISEYTESPEMFEGRVKTLHPKILGGILFRRDNGQDVKDAEKYGIPPIDMVVCNLYPFKSIIEKTTELKTCLEQIDIGGPTMIRAAAKNFPDVVVVPDPKFYNLIIKELRKNKGAISEKIRADLAKEVFV
ncbi:MAG: bifunctional phosphoribosylaminoimidazolecarboxamide formyltransferase/IMP cyclohydrolase, partial [Promethearchaeia archaeon]